jgi:hypothetical protein
MPIQYCEICDQYIDLDTDVEHFDDHLPEYFSWKDAYKHMLNSADKLIAGLKESKSNGT